MTDKKTPFALFFGNRGFFPASLIAEAREELPRVLKAWGHDVLTLEEEATRYGAVETPREGEIYANFLREKRGKFGGVILCLPNFGDETGAVAALHEANVPVLIQAYPDDLDRMAPEVRRDAFCGKISIMDVFCQYGVTFTALKPHVVRPSSDQFKANVDHFDRVCRVVNGMRGMVVGAIGARTTAFKTVRIDEVALQRHGITVETLDLSDVFARMDAVGSGDEGYKAKAERLRAYTCWEGVPEEAFSNIVRLGVVLDGIIEEYQMDAIALRCWIEMQEQLGISPCVLLGELNNRGVPAACEVDVGNAVAMYALHVASGGPAACLDWNNNYGEEEEKCILFHCGPVPKGLMADEGRITDHAIVANVVGEGCSYGCHVGRMAPFDFTFGSMLTDAGRPRFYLGQGRFTEDQIPSEFFGCAGVAQIERLQDVLLHVGHNGYRHHVSVTGGLVQAAVREGLEHYLGFEVALPQEG
jgi:L-fucose isomerase-like protein